MEITAILRGLEWIDRSGTILIVALLAVVVLLMIISAWKGGSYRMGNDTNIYIQNRNGKWRVWSNPVGCSQEFPSQLDTPAWKSEEEALAFAEGWHRWDEIKSIEVLPPHVDLPAPITESELWELWKRVLSARGIKSLELVKDPFCIYVWLRGKHVSSVSFGSAHACVEWMDSKLGETSDRGER